MYDRSDSPLASLLRDREAAIAAWHYCSECPPSAERDERMADLADLAVSAAVEIAKCRITTEKVADLLGAFPASRGQG